MSPILILAAGRSGTTWLVRLLSTHPEIVAHTAYPCELRLTAMLCHPDHPVAGDKQSLSRFRFDGDDGLFAGELEPMVIEEAYRRIGRGKTPRYFVEKFFGFLDIGAVSVHFPGARIVHLVRDPRDVLMSARALDARRGYRGFQERDGDTEEQIVVKYRNLFATMEANLSKAADTYLIRYEDLIQSPEETILGLLKWLGLPSFDVRDMLAGGQAFDANGHKTAASDIASVGRWRNEMPLSLQALYEAHLGPYLRRLGYSQ